MSDWRVRDPSGLVHYAVVVTHQILLYDNNVDYEDQPLTLCMSSCDGWADAAPGEITTCVACASHVDGR